MPSKPIIAVTMGDPAGIGPEIILKALADPIVKRISRPLILGDWGVLQRAGRGKSNMKKLLDLLNRLTDSGNTVVMVEHQLDMIKNADFIIDLGPESGTEGGEIVAAGTPEQVAAVAGSVTGQYLRQILGLSLDNQAKTIA